MGAIPPERRVVYIDPPYRGTTAYLGDVRPPTRAAVVRRALRAHEWGATVLVSEGEPIAELVELGWEVRELRGPPDNSVAGWSRVGEFVTMSPRGPNSGGQQGLFA